MTTTENLTVDRRRIRFEDCADDGMTRSRLQELRRRDPVAHHVYMRALARDVLEAWKRIRATDREHRAIRKAAACGVRHRRASRSAPTRRRGSRRSTASRGDPDDLGDEPPSHRRPLIGGRI